LYSTPMCTLDDGYILHALEIVVQR
jgi:hypothetical protein